MWLRKRTIRERLRSFAEKARSGNLYRWELALALSLTFTLLESAVTSGAAWWGVIFPGLTPASLPEAVDAMKLSGGRTAEALRMASSSGDVELRFLLLDWLAQLLRP